MAQKAKKQAQLTANESAQEVSAQSDQELSNIVEANETPGQSDSDQDPSQGPAINQEIRLAEAQPGDIEALEQTIDTLEERCTDQATHIINLEDDIEELESYLMDKDEIIEELESALICLEPVLSLVNAQQNLITSLVERLNTQSTALSSQPTRSTDRKSEALALLNPNNASTWPGPAVSITQLAQAMGTNNKNVSSVLSGLRDQGYQIATDELGRKFIKAYHPGQSAKTPKYTSYEAATSSQPALSPEALTNIISQANQTIVKRTVSADGKTTLTPVNN